MKIIASTSMGWLLEATDEEVGKLAGFLDNVRRDRNGYDNGAKRFGINSLVPIAPMYDYLHDLRHIEGQLNDTREKLEALAKLLTIPEALKPIAEEIQEEIKAHQ